MTRRIACALTAALGVLACVTPPADARPSLHHVVQRLQDANGHYRYGAANLSEADCSGLVSVAQSLAMGLPPKRFGNTHSLIAGQWPHAIPGARPDDLFIIGTNSQHMVAQVAGIRIEARQSGERWRFGDAAASPFDPRFTHRYHIDPAVLK